MWTVVGQHAFAATGSTPRMPRRQSCRGAGRVPSTVLAAISSVTQISYETGRLNGCQRGYANGARHPSDRQTPAGPADTVMPAAASPRSATDNSPTRTASHGNAGHSPKAGDHPTF